MTIPRRKQLCLDVTPYYHCLTRCVRQAFLCGRDKHSDRNLNHRRKWIEKHLLLLTKVFCIDVAGYAVMSNHYHVVLKVDPQRATALSNDQIIERWTQLYKGPPLVQRYQSGETLNETDRGLLADLVLQWRDHMTNISRFMGNLNETIARRANQEDGCKGRFWESRFKMQAILDLPALIRTLCYVDLNPVRAKIAKTPESSRYTSVRKRLNDKTTDLLPFAAAKSIPTSCQHLKKDYIPITFTDYLTMLDWTGREQQKGKRGFIAPSAPTIIQRLGFTPDQWLKTQTPQLGWMQRALGNSEAIKIYCTALGQRWIWRRAFER